MKIYFVNFNDTIKEQLKKSTIVHKHSLKLLQREDVNSKDLEGLIFYYLENRDDQNLMFIKEIQKENKINVKLVLVSSSLEIAVLAWRLNCFYFIQLPLNLIEIYKCIQNANERTSFSFQLKDGISTHYINENEVNFLRANGNYTSLHLKEGKSILVSKKIKYFDSLFSEIPGIVRIGKSFMLNIKHIKKVDKQNIHFLGTNAEQLKLSNLYISRINKLLTEYIL